MITAVPRPAQFAPTALLELAKLDSNDAGMSLTPQSDAWLEHNGEERPLHGNCSIGRAALNWLVLDSAKVSRLHSIIQLEDNGAFWLIDLGSSNGTFLNKRRIHQPVRLRDRDQISIGAHAITFRQPREKPSAELEQTKPLLTVQELETAPCWLLLADIKNFTPLSRSMVSDELANLVSCWLATCIEIIERNAGAVNKYLGDGILAYWRDDAEAVGRLRAVIAAFKDVQTGSGPAFRFVVHVGPIAIGGIASMREETLMGSEVNLLFRLEKVLASLDEPCGISAAAQARLGEYVTTRRLGEVELKGFQERQAVFAV